MALAVGAATFAASYAIQRLWAAFGDPAGAPMLLGEAYIPYYWRCALAWVQAMIVVPIVGMGIGERAADRLLRTVPIWLSVVVGVSAVAMGLVP